MQQVWKGDGPSSHDLDDIADKRLHPRADWGGAYERKTKEWRPAELARQVATGSKATTCR